MKSNKHIGEFLAIFFIFIATGYFGYSGKTTEMGLSIVAGAIALAFLNIDKISKFKGVGFEAEMKQAVNEAYATTKTVRELAKAMSIFSINNLAIGGRFGGTRIIEKHKIKGRIDSVCKELNIQDIELEKASELFYKLHTIDHFRTIHKKVRSQVSKDKEKEKQLDSFFQFSLETELPSLYELKKLFKTLKIDLSPEIDEAIENLSYYLEFKYPRNSKATD